MRFGAALLAMMAMLLGAGPGEAGQPIPRDGRAITLTVRQIPLNPEAPGEQSLGALTFKGGMELVSKDPDFGGLSGIAIAPDESHFVAITDTGRWVCASLELSKTGTLKSVSAAWISPLKGLATFDMTDKDDADSEALAIAPDGRAAFVAFEGKHRVWRYAIDDTTDLCSAASSPAQPIDMPLSLKVLPDNGGIESFAVLPDHQIIAIGEDRLRKTKAQPGWIGAVRADGTYDFTAFAYDAAQPFKPTDIAATPDGLFILHRHFSFLSGVSGMLSWAALPNAKSNGLMPQRLASFRPPITVDNFEGVSAVPDGSGGYTLYIVSDDNFSPIQRTLLLKFSLDKETFADMKSP